MKIRNSSRIIALALVLMMIVPLISIPAFAADEATLLWSQNFDGATVEETIVKGSSYNESVFIKDDAMLFDLSNGPSDEYKNGGADALYLTPNNKDVYYKLDVAYVHPTTGRVTGTATVKDSNGAAVNVLVENAVINTNNFDTTVTLYSGTINEDDTSYWWNEAGDDVLCDDAGEIIPGPGNSTNNGAAGTGTLTTWYLVNAQVCNARGGGANIASHIYAKQDALTASGTVVTYSADYYFNEGWNATAENHLMGSEFRALSFTKSDAAKKSESNLKIAQHGNITMTDGAAVEVALGHWVNITIVADYSNATYKVYVNGNYAFTAVDSDNLGNASAQVSNGQVTLKANQWNFIQANRGSSVNQYTGYVMVDNAAIYDGEYVPAASTIPAYLWSENFNDGTFDYKSVSNGLDVSDKYTVYGDRASVTNANTNGVATGNPAGTPVNTNVKLPTTTAMSYTDYPILVFEADYYFPTGTRAQIQSQFHNPVKDSQGNSYNWTSIYVFHVLGDHAEMLRPSGDQTASNAITYNSELPMDRWFTFSTVVDQVNGKVYQYVDGVQMNEFDFYKSKHIYETTIPQSGWIYAKLNTFAGTTFSTGYMGDYGIDNVEIFTDPEMIKNYQGIRDDRYFKYDYEDATEGEHAPSMADANYPVSAAYTKLDGNMAVKFDMLTDKAVASSVKGDFIGFSYNSRLYWLTNGETVNVPDDATFNPDDDISVNASKLTFLANSYGETTKKIYIARNGDKAYIYASGNTAHFSAEVEDKTTLTLWTTLDIVSADDPQAAAKYEAMIGGVNTDKPWNVEHPIYSYNADGDTNTYVFSADYYITEDAKGAMESQFRTSAFFRLYGFNFTNKTFVGHVNKSIAIELGQWYNVKVVATLTESEGINFKTYLNGVLFETFSYTGMTTGITANSWIAAKIMKNMSTTPNAGSYYIDNVSCEKYDTAKDQTIDLTNAISATVNGNAISVSSASIDVYSDNVVVTTWADIADSYAAIITTQEAASIRLNSPTGLRFASKVDTDMVAALEAMGATVEFGTLITPASKVDEKGGLPALDSTDWTLNTDYIDVVAGKNYSELTTLGEGTYITGSIVKIKEANMDRDFTGVGYAKITLSNGSVVYIYSAQSWTVSVADQAQKTLDASPDLDTEGSIYKILSTYAAYAE